MDNLPILFTLSLFSLLYSDIPFCRKANNLWVFDIVTEMLCLLRCSLTIYPLWMYILKRCVTVSIAMSFISQGSSLFNSVPEWAAQTPDRRCRTLWLRKRPRTGIKKYQEEGGVSWFWMVRNVKAWLRKVGICGSSCQPWSPFHPTVRWLQTLLTS